MFWYRLPFHPFSPSVSLFCCTNTNRRVHFLVGVPHCLWRMKMVIDQNIHTNELWIAPNISHFVYSYNGLYILRCHFENFGNNYYLFTAHASCSPLLSSISFTGKKDDPFTIVYRNGQSGDEKEEEVVKVLPKKKYSTIVDHCWPYNEHVCVCVWGSEGVKSRPMWFDIFATSANGIVFPSRMLLKSATRSQVLLRIWTDEQFKLL